MNIKCIKSEGFKLDLTKETKVELLLNSSWDDFLFYVQRGNGEIIAEFVTDKMAARSLICFLEKFGLNYAVCWRTSECDEKVKNARD